jgi:N-acyl-D-aspartate/D-glutamate deacylase
MTVLRNARVVDGSGASARAADVTVDRGTITGIHEPGRASSDGEVVDLDGLVLAPGFIDCHTHYDAQVLWDRDLTPSGWHGVTTVVMGNCGFGIAPTRTSDRDTIARTLENVEGMSVAALAEGIPWTFESFPEYLDAIEKGGTRLNTAVMIGHTPLRLYVLGDDASERPATAEEIAEMRRLVGEAMDAGAIGFATSKQEAHAGAGGKPVPSRLAEPAEIFEIAGALADRDRGVIAITRGADFQLAELARLSIETGRPVTWTALAATAQAAALLDQQDKLGGDVWPQLACRPIVMQLTLADPGPLARAHAFTEALAVPHELRAAVYADPAWRERARVDMASTWGSKRYERIFVQETDIHTDLKDGPSIAAIAAARGLDPLDVMCDLALAEGLRTRFKVVLANDDEAQLAALLLDDRTRLGLSDAGAHASQLCDAVFSTHLLQHWVRETGVLTLEKAIWRLTGHQAAVFGLPTRGRIEPGAAADLVAFDAATIGVETMERVFDFPAGADRLIARSRGIEAMWVNGTVVRQDGKDLPDVRPGTLIRDGGV